MASKAQTGYGYIRDEAGPLTSVISFTYQFTTNNSPQMTLLNENGVNEGTTQVKISTKHTVPKGQEEQARLLEATINKTDIQFVWSVGRLQMTASGKADSASGGSEVNRPNTFDLEFMGFLDDYQADPVT